MPMSICDKASGRPRRIGFLLLPGFALLSYSCAIEPYRAANALAGRALYVWRHISPDGAPVHASSGVCIAPDQGVDRPAEVDDLFVCAGGNPATFMDEATLAWLRAEARRSLRLGGVSGGPFVLARARLLDGYRCTVHWEHLPAMAEEFPALRLARTIYELDGPRCTAAGGTAALDMMAALIAAEHGAALANAVSEWFLHPRLRDAGEPQRMAVRHRYGVASPALMRALTRMEGALETPLPRAALAEAAGVSIRQLERLFRDQLARSIAAHYTALRLDRARVLLQQSTLSVLEVSLACGFATAAHFSRVYKARFGEPPRMQRRQRRGEPGVARQPANS